MLPSFTPRSQRRGALCGQLAYQPPVNICQKGRSPDGTAGEVCVSVHVHVPDRSFVHVWIPVCAVTAACKLSPTREGSSWVPSVVGSCLSRATQRLRLWDPVGPQGTVESLC